MTKWFNNILFLLSLGVSACTHTEDPIIQYFRQSGDSLYMKSYLFLKENASRNERIEMKNNQKFTIEDIQLAVNSNRQQLTDNLLSFDIFCNYILPQRIFREKPGKWRVFYRTYFSHLAGLSLAATCDSINDHFKKEFRFGESRQSYQTIEWQQLHSLSTGGCYLMAKSLVYPLRAMGIPTTIDFIYTWGNAAGAHCWNVVYREGRMVPFMGRESNPGIYNPFLAYKNETDTLKSVFRYPPKIFRKTYAINPELLQLRKKFAYADIPPILTDIRIKDVTAEYFSVSDISMKKGCFLPGEPGYLAVYGKDWKVVAIAESAIDSSYLFRNMKRDMLYMPARYENKQTQPLGHPLILQEDGNIQELVPNKQKHIDVTIKFLYPLLNEYLYAWAHRDSLSKDIFHGLALNKYRRRPLKGETYILYYWNKQSWQMAGKEKTLSNQLQFKAIPANALYILADKEGNLLGRSFTMEEGKMNWW